MNENFEQVRYEQLKRCIPDIFKAGSLLYVGGHFRYGRDLQMTRFFRCPIDIVEVWPENVKQLKEAKHIRKVFQSDIRDFMPPLSYEVTMFWHGPEHLEKDELVPLILKMAQYTTKYIVFATPFGVYEQGAEYNNPYEEHKTHWTLEDFQEMGFECDAIGVKDAKQGNIIAWVKL